MSHNGSTPRIHVAELWGGSGKSSVTLKHDRSMCARRWGSEACSCRTGRARTSHGATSSRSGTQTAGPGTEHVKVQVNEFASRWGQDRTGRAAAVATHLAPLDCPQTPPPAFLVLR